MELRRLYENNTRIAIGDLLSDYGSRAKYDPEGKVTKYDLDKMVVHDHRNAVAAEAKRSTLPPKQLYDGTVAWCRLSEVRHAGDIVGYLLEIDEPAGKEARYTLASHQFKICAAADIKIIRKSVWTLLLERGEKGALVALYRDGEPSVVRLLGRYYVFGYGDLSPLAYLMEFGEDAERRMQDGKREI